MFSRSWLQAGGRDERNCGKCLWLVSMSLTSYQIRYTVVLKYHMILAHCRG